MFYEISFTKTVPLPAQVAPEFYINECCWGCNVVRDELLPVISARYERVETGQEDWGWYIWFWEGPLRLQVNIQCDDPKRGEFRIRLEAQRKKFLFFKCVDAQEIEDVLNLVKRHLELWAGRLHIEKD